MLEDQKSSSHRFPRLAWEPSKKIQKTHKSKIFLLDARYRKLGKWDATYLLHDTSKDSSVTEAILQCQCIMTWETLKTHTSHIILFMVHIATKPCSSPYKETAPHNTCQSPSHCLPSKPLLPCDLAHTHYNVRQGNGPYMMRVINYAHFALNKFGSLSIKLCYDDLPLITSQYAFHTSLTKPILPRNPLIVTMCILDCDIHQ